MSAVAYDTSGPLAVITATAALVHTGVRSALQG
jgi:hypothetical protein